MRVACLSAENRKVWKSPEEVEKPQLSHVRGHFTNLGCWWSSSSLCLLNASWCGIFYSVQLKFNKPMGVQFPILVDRLDTKSKFALQWFSDVDYLGNWTASAHCHFTSLFPFWSRDDGTGVTKTPLMEYVSIKTHLMGKMSASNLSWIGFGCHL